ncbi:MAG: carbohydrate ABC transporter permease [Ardenticatenaceae bacterium]|nr:carbohydrate ABC transporter permease [Ardenticatenaceae bacterium]
MAQNVTSPTSTFSREIFERRLGVFLKWFSIAFFILITVFPFYWMLNLSFRPFQDVLTDPTRLIPRVQDFQTVFAPLSCIFGGDPEFCEGAVRNSSYAAVLIQFNFLRFIRNSLILSGLTVVLSIVISVPAAYAISRLRFRGRSAMNWGILLIYMFPGIVISIPLFVFFVRIQQSLGIQLRSPVGVTLIYLASTLPLALYMLRGYFDTIPPDLEEAAMIDGATRMVALWRVTIPLAMPAIASVALYVFMIAWNEFLYALLFLIENPAAWTLPLGLQQLDSQEVPRTFLMAGSVIISVPVIVLFLFFERFLTGGLTAGGVKG